MVCTGNICRSPMAEGLLRHRLAADSPTKVASAGVGALISHPADPIAVDLMSARGIDISAHRGMVDPAAVGGDERTRDRAFRAAYYELERRIQIFTQLPITSLDRMSLQRRVDEIGGDRGDAA